MKTEISRNSFNPKKRYAGVYQQQGRMITDADLNELVDIIRYELEQLFCDVVGNGVPRNRALSIIQDTNDQNKIKIQPGMVYVDGVRGDVDANTLTSLDNQIDFPVSTTHYAGSKPSDVLVYADIWQTSADRFDDPDLVDVALGGADTTTRSKVVTQIKLAPKNTDLSTLPQCGNGFVTLKPQVQDGLPIQTTGNYLFRLEVHQVELDDQLGITALTLKWSTNNAASKYPIQEAASDNQFGPVYEMFNAETELYAGLQLIDKDQIQVGTLVDTLPEDFKTYTFIRAWDGYCTLRCQGSTWTLDTSKDISTHLSPEDIEIDNDYFKLRISTLELTLCLKESNEDKQFITGDYWQIAVRERAQITNTADAFAKNVLPQGIVHHYTPLATIDSSGKLTLLSKVFSQAVDPVFDGNVTLGTDDNSVTTVQGKVGIGTSNPQARLHIYSATQALLKIQGNSVDEAGCLALRKQDNSGADLYYDAKQNTNRFVIDMVSNDNTKQTAFVISNNGTHKGNVGIGVLDPAKKLDVGGDATITGTVNITGDLYVNGIAHLGTTDTGKTINSNVQNNLIIINSGQTGSTVTAGEAGLEIDRGTGAHYKLLFRESEQAFTVAKPYEGVTQQVIATRESKPVQYGIGAWNETLKQSITNTNFTYDTKTLQIKGSSAPLLKLQATAESSAASALSLRQSKNSGCDMYYDGTTDNESFKFELFQNNVSAGKPLAISNKSGQVGNIGMGTESPNSRLHVVGSKGAGSSIQIDNSEIKFRSDAEQHVSLYNSHYPGNFTIENTDKNAAMGATGKLLFSVSHAGRVGIATYNPTIYLAIGDNDTGLNWHGDGKISIYTDNAERVRFDGLGNVGIGITEPNARLHVVGSKGVGSSVQVQNNEIKFRSDTEKHVSLYNSRYPGNFTIESSGDKTMGTSENLLFSVNHAGRIGVAISNPTIHLAVGDNDTGLNQQGENELAVYTNNSERMRISKTGKVGIGKTAPTAELDVNGTISTNALTTTGKVGIGKNAPATELDVNGTVNANALTITGKVGIGKTAPTAELDVNGTINTNVLTTTGKVGIGKAAPTADLDVNGTINTNAMTIKGLKPFILKNYTSLGDNVNYETAYTTDAWVAAVVGFKSLNGDIDENGTKSVMLQVYTYQKSGKWWIGADFADDNAEEWSVDVLFIRKELVDINPA